MQREYKRGFGLFQKVGEEFQPLDNDNFLCVLDTKYTRTPTEYPFLVYETIHGPQQRAWRYWWAESLWIFTLLYEEVADPPRALEQFFGEKPGASRQILADMTLADTVILLSPVWNNWKVLQDPGSLGWPGVEVKYPPLWRAKNMEEYIYESGALVNWSGGLSREELRKIPVG